MGTASTTALLKPGLRVRRRSRPDHLGIICDGPRTIAGRDYFSVSFDNEIDQYPHDDLEPLDHVGSDLRSQLLNGTFGGRETLSRLVTFTKLDSPLRDVLYSFRSTRTKFEAYQFKPLVKFLESPRQRLLIADEVGLGKTIEAGYILRELKARQPTSCKRVLVVCPSPLREKWRSEMERRFDERFEIFDSKDVREKVINAWERRGERTAFHAICSMQTLRGRRAGRPTHAPKMAADWELDPRARRTLLDDFDDAIPQLDLVIIDEAHHMRNPGSLVHRLGHVLSEKADALVMLTATPIHRGEQDLFELLRILDPQEFDQYESFANRTSANEKIVDAERALRGSFPADFGAVLGPLVALRDHPWLSTLVNRDLLDELIDDLPTRDPERRSDIVELQFKLNQINLLSHSVSRTRKRDIQEEKPVRTPSVLRPAWTAIETDFYRAVTATCHKAYQERSGDFAARFAVQQLQRQLASSIPATLRRYRSLISEASVRHARFADPDELLDEDDESRGSVIDDPAFQQVFDEYESLIGKPGKKPVDSKFDAFEKALAKLDREEPGRKLVVFSFFKSTLAYLEERLRGLNISCVLISGDVPSRPTDPARDERGNRVKAFHDPEQGIRVLLSSEVGSEGLDFHKAAYIIVNYDLPWNPMVVEQRIGRLDRYEQPSKRILIWNFSMTDTIEDRILERLYERIGVFEQTIGDLEPILGDAIETIESIVTDGSLTPTEMEAQATQTLDAIAQKRKHLETIEAESSTFVSRDEYFIDQVRSVQERKRYLTPQELQLFTSDFYTRQRLAWNDDTGEAGVFEFTWCKPLAEMLESHLSVDDRSELRFRHKAYGSRIACTFDHELAYQRPELELLSARHPLLRAIHAKIKSEADTLHPIAAVTLDGVGRAGECFYQLFLLKQSGAVQDGRHLDAIFIDQSGVVLTRDESERLLFEMITRGQPWHDPPALDVAAADHLLALTESVLVGRKDEREAALNRHNAIITERQLTSLRSSLDAKVEKLKRRLISAKEKQQEPRYLRMIEGQVRNLETDFDSKRGEIESRRTLRISYRPIGAGFVRITS